MSTINQITVGSTTYDIEDGLLSDWARASTKPSYTASEVGAVPTTRKVNGKALSANITLAASDVNALPSDALANRNLYYINVACAVSTGDIATVSNAAITANHVVAEISFAEPSYITTDVTWTTSSGSLILSGTCTNATTANILLVLKDN